MRSATPRSIENRSILQVMLVSVDARGELANGGPTPIQDNSAKNSRTWEGAPVDLADLVNVVNVVIRGSAKLELCLVDVQRLDAMVEGGRRNAKSRGGSRCPGDTAPALGECGLNHLSLVP